MESFTEEETKTAKEFADFYVDLMDNHKETLKFYLSDNAVLDWFGQTIKGVKKIGEFIKCNVSNVTHSFPNMEPCSNIGHRKTHVINYTPSENVTDLKVIFNEEKTPPNTIFKPSSSRKREIGQGHVSDTSNQSPVKKSRGIAEMSVSEVSSPVKICNISSNGHLQFTGRSSKKYQKETKWSRPCKFEAAYSESPSGYIIHLIIYQGNMRCRRNLLKEFESLEESD